MSSYEEMTKSLSHRFNDQINKSCQKLFNDYGLIQFYYCKITNDGFLVNIDSDAAWAEYICDTKLYRSYPYFCHPKYIQGGVSLIKESQDKVLQETIHAGKENFNYELWYRCVVKTAQGIEEFGFSSNSSSEQQIFQLFNSQSTLNSFLSYFKKENKAIFSSIDDHRIDVGQLIGTSFSSNRGISKQKTPFMDTLCQSIGSDCYNRLTSREKEVLKLAIHGYPASKIALQVFLSRRTVEHYIEKIKEKLFCNSKAELIEKAKQFECLGML